MSSPKSEDTFARPAAPADRAPATASPELAFSKKYTPEHARQYFEKHQTGLRRRLTTWRENALARRALAIAGEPSTVLDIPCGTGRFWPLLAERPGRRIFAADLNPGMLETARQMRPPELVARVELFEASAFSIPRPDGFVEAVVCIRLLHHIQDPEHRVLMLKELARVASGTVIVSLWLDGNYQAWRWHRKARTKPAKNRFPVERRVIEDEFARCGLRVAARLDFLPFVSMWTTYVLNKA